MNLPYSKTPTMKQLHMWFSFQKKCYSRVRKTRKSKQTAISATSRGSATNSVATNSNGSTKEEASEAKNLILRHAGILGLCAFVNAYPYDVPEFIPDTLMFLSDYIHEPQPISVTIKRTLQEFKRTHQDNWQDHKLRFSDDQLAILTDILVSPSYYA